MEIFLTIYLIGMVVVMARIIAVKRFPWGQGRNGSIVIAITVTSLLWPYTLYRWMR